jgi:hypothetical protein
MFRRTCEDNLVGDQLQKGRRRDRQRKRWGVNFQEWAGLRLCDTLRETETERMINHYNEMNAAYICKLREYFINAIEHVSVF